MKKKDLLRLGVSLSLSLGCALLFFFISSSRTYQSFELKTLDLRFNLRGPLAIRAPVVHIDMDDNSLAKLGRWPWPRSLHAVLFDTLYECGAKAVLMDIIFSEEVKDAPEEDQRFSEALKESAIVYLPFYAPEGRAAPEPEMGKLLLEDITVSAEDAAIRLNKDIREVKDSLPLAKRYVVNEVVAKILHQKPELSADELLQTVEDKFGWFLFPAEEAYVRESFDTQKLAQQFGGRFAKDIQVSGFPPLMRKAASLVVPIEAYSEVIKGSGFINSDTDLDGVTRRVPLLMKFEDDILPQLSFNAVCDFLQVPAVKLNPGSLVLKDAVIDGRRRDISIPIDQKGSMLINWAGRWTDSFSHLPYYLVVRLKEVRNQLQRQAQLLDSVASSDKEKAMREYIKNDADMLKEKLTAMVKGKICIVGLTATGTQDMGPIPLQTNFPMVGLHSNLINTIITGNFLRKAPVKVNVLIFLVTAVFIGISCSLKLWQSLLLSVFYAGGYFVFSFLLFAKAGLWLDLVGPEGIVLFGFSAITTFRFFTEEKEKLWIKQAFGHYLSQEVINQLMNDPSKLKLGGERRNLTVFFSDVRGFTTYSEAHEPEEVVAMLNQLLSEQVEVIFKNNGTLDKFVGDEVMAFFGAPSEIHRHDHALAAVRTAVEIQAKIKALQEKWAEEAKAVLAIGVGINSGDMVVGNMGSAKTMDYTVIGDNVNLGARLCSAAGKNEIIISEATYEQVKDNVTAEKLEPITVKGKSMPISIYRVTAINP